MTRNPNSKARTLCPGLAVCVSVCCLSLATTAAGSATTAAATTRATWTTTTTTAIVVVAHRGTSAARGYGLTHWDRRAFNAVEVGLVLLIKLFTSLLLEVVSAFDENGALV